jgi:hypothetical protein
MHIVLAPGLEHEEKRPYVEERRAAVRVLIVRGNAVEGLDRATKVTLGILRVTVLPVVPYFINHLPPSRTNR